MPPLRENVRPRAAWGRPEPHPDVVGLRSRCYNPPSMDAGPQDASSTARPCPYCGVAVTGAHSACAGLFKDVMSLPAESTLDELPPEALAFETDETRQLGDYILVQQIGKGGMGTVWKGWDRKLTRWVAVKFLNGQDQDDFARFSREAKLAARLRHPNIAAVFDTGEVPSKQAGQEAVRYLAMEFIEGESVSVAQLPLLRWLEVFARVARAVDHAHKSGVVHRDLKPSNLMLTREGWPYVMDFGLAKSLKAGSSVSISGVILGTPAFMPPEQAAGKTRETDPRCDIYSLGATLYYVLTRQEPYRGEDSVDIIVQVLQNSPTPPRELNPALPRPVEAVILKAMARDKSRRYATAAEMAEDLERLAREGASGPAVPPRRTAAGVAGILVAGSVLLAAVLVARRPAAPPPSPGPAPVEKASPLPRFVGRFRELKEARRWREAHQWVEKEGGFLAASESADYQHELEADCREALRKATSAFCSGPLAERLESAPAGFKFESLASQLPPPDELLLPDPKYDWTRRLLPRIDAGQPSDLLEAAREAVAFEDSGENPWFLAAELAAYQSLKRSLKGWSDQARGGTRGAVRACRDEAEKLGALWEAFGAKLPAAFRNRHAALLGEHDREVGRAREDFPRSPPYIETVDFGKLLDAPDAESKLEEVEQKLRELWLAGNLTQESQQSLLVRLVTARALGRSFQGVPADQIALGLRDLAVPLKALEVSAEDRTRYGPKVAAVFDRLLR